jgi:hypothetical protein
MAERTTNLYDPTLDIWPDLARGRIALAPVRVGMDRTTGKMLVGWPHVVQSIQVILATRYHERVLRRWCGSFVPHILGESATPKVITRFFWAIASSIELWEPNYRITRVRVQNKGDRDDTSLTSVEELRRGEMTNRIEGVYRPRGHLGDPTPESRRSAGLIQRSSGYFEARSA